MISVVPRPEAQAFWFADPARETLAMSIRSTRTIKDTEDAFFYHFANSGRFGWDFMRAGK